MRWLLPILLLLAACSTAPGEADSVAVIDRFHSALNANDTAAIDGLLSQSTRNLRPGIGTARAFRAISARHGRYLEGRAARVTSAGEQTRIDWQARYERGAVAEQFALVREGGAVKIDSYTDNAAS